MNPPDAGALLLGATDCTVHRIGRFATRLANSRWTELIEHAVVGRIDRPAFGLALGYEDLVEDELRHDSLQDPQLLGSKLN